jgi:hypothetical protein
MTRAGMAFVRRQPEASRPFATQSIPPSVASQALTPPCLATWARVPYSGEILRNQK